MFVAQEQALVDALADGPGDVPMQLAAAALASVFRILYYEGRRRLLAGETDETIVPALRALATAGFGALTDALPPVLLTAD